MNRKIIISLTIKMDQNGQFLRRRPQLYYFIFLFSSVLNLIYTVSDKIYQNYWIIKIWLNILLKFVFIWP